MKYLYFLLSLIHSILFCMELTNRNDQKNWLSQQLNLKSNAIIMPEGNKTLIAQIKSSCHYKSNLIKNELILIQAHINNKELISTKKVSFDFPGTKILPCYGTLYATNPDNIFYQVAIESFQEMYQTKLDREYEVSQLNSDKYILECGVEFSSQKDFSKHTYKLFIDVDLDNSGEYTSVIDFITFPVLLQSILATSKTGIIIRDEETMIKVLQWKNVILPENYKNFRYHPWCPFKVVKSFDDFFGTDFKEMCEDKYQKQKI